MIALPIYLIIAIVVLLNQYFAFELILGLNLFHDILKKKVFDDNSIFIFWKEFAVVLLFTLLTIRNKRMQKWFSNKTSLDFFISLFCIYLFINSVLNIIHGSDLMEVFSGSRAIAIWLLLYFIVKNISISTTRYRFCCRLNRLLSFLYLSVTVYGYYQFLYLPDDRGISDSFGLLGVSSRATSLVGNANALGIFIIIAILIFYYFHSLRILSNLKFLFFTLLGLPLLYLTYSRTAIIAGIICLLLIISRKNLVLAILSTIALLIISTASVKIDNPLFWRLTKESKREFQMSGYANARVFAIQQTFKRASNDYWICILGSGAGTYGGYIYGKSSDDYYLGNTKFILTENQFLKLFGELGIIGLALFIIIIFLAIKIGASSPIPQQRYLILPLIALCISFFGGNQLDSMILAAWFWIIIGLIRTYNTRSYYENCNVVN